MNNYIQLEFDFMRSPYTQLEFDFDTVDNIKYEISSGSIKFNYNNKFYEYKINKNYSPDKSNQIAYKIKFILNGKQRSTKSLKEFYILYYLVNKYGTINIDYEKSIDISELSFNRKVIKPDFYIKSLNRYIEFHNSMDDGKYELYMNIAKIKGLNIDWWRDCDYYKNINSDIISSHIVVSPGFCYNFDIKLFSGYSTYAKETNLNDLIIFLLDLNILPNKELYCDYTGNYNKFVMKYLKLSTSKRGKGLKSNARSVIDYISKDINKKYSLKELINVGRYKVCKLQQLKPIIKFYNDLGITLNILSK